ncbi:hypothetical protein LTR17_003707 [Elasticomyces elasticus]|nr:hypothetical protein LTR17_003707 [Elasticomyces elasticus]
MDGQTELRQNGTAGDAATEQQRLGPNGVHKLAESHAQAFENTGTENRVHRRPVPGAIARDPSPPAPGIIEQPDSQEVGGNALPTANGGPPQVPALDKWRAWQLKYWMLVSTLLLELALIGAMAGLLRQSHLRDGFVAVSERVPVSVAIGSAGRTRNLRMAFLWTTIPTFFMSLFAILWGSIVDAYAYEVPFRVLRSRTGGTLKHTVCLDYREKFKGWNIIVAWGNRDVLLGFCMCLSLLFTVALVPLAAHLFEVNIVTFQEPASFAQQNFYDESKLVALIDYEPVIGIVSAVLVFGGSWPAWTDGNYSVSAFTPSASDPDASNITEYQISTTAVSATLDCEVVPSYSLVRTPPDGDTATIALSATDRGCNVSLTAGVGPGNRLYLKTVSTTDCGDSNYSRISYLAGAYSPSAPYLLEKMQVVSCIPSYGNTTGTINAPQSFLPLSFQPGNTIAPTDARPNNWRLFENQLIALSNLGDNNSPDFTSQFGNLILSMIDADDPSLELDADTLIATTTTAFRSCFAILARTHLYQSLASSQPASGSLTYAQARLAAVAWSMYLTISLIAVVIVLTALLIWFIGSVEPVLAEQPHGILGAAAMAFDGNLDDILRGGEWRQEDLGRFQIWLEKTYILGGERCYYNQKQGVIRVDGLRRRLPHELA